MSIRDWGYDGPAVLAEGALPARVLGTWGDYYRVVCDIEDEVLVILVVGVAHRSSVYRRR